MNSQSTPETWRGLDIEQRQVQKKQDKRNIHLQLEKKSKEVEKVKNGRMQENKNKQLHFLTNRFRRDFTFYPIQSDIVWVLRRPCSFTLSPFLSLSLSLSLLTSRVKFLERRPGKEVIN